MRPNLDSLSEEIQHYLADEHFVVFRSLSRASDEGRLIYWDSEHSPDYRAFLECAQHLGLRLVHFHSREFCHHHREEALELMNDADVPRERKRAMQKRIEELAIYEGFTCAIELSFDYEGRIYLFELQTEWYEDWHDILDELEASGPDGSEDSGSYGGFYSNN